MNNTGGFLAARLYNSTLDNAQRFSSKAEAERWVGEQVKNVSDTYLIIPAVFLETPVIASEGMILGEG